MTDNPQTIPNATLASESYNEKFDRMKRRKEAEITKRQSLHVSELSNADLKATGKTKAAQPCDRQDFVCDDCGTEFGNAVPDHATWHDGECSICGEEKPVTQARDFGFGK
jgi:hypothetical protein